MTATLTEVELQTTEIVSRPGAGTWLNVVAHLDPRYGGISAVVPSFCEAVSRVGLANAALAPFCDWDEQFEAPHSVEGERYPLGNTKWRGGDEVCRRLPSVGLSSAVLCPARAID